MPYYQRDLENKLKRYAKFPVVAILGPRQSGKSTIAKEVFKNHVFLDLDDLELRAQALNDPKAFLRTHENEHGIILDEFQRCPELLSYIKVISDAQDRPGYFVLTGSQNFLMNASISESLAGRVGILTLLPLSLHELEEHALLQKEKPEHTIFFGGYPRLYERQIDPSELYPSYLQTYVERDVRELINVTNLNTFQKFLRLCAGRIGQQINFAELAAQCGISVPTVHNWLSILEASYITFQLRPYWANFNKIMTKSPKLYFYDTGLACLLLGISSEKNLLLNFYYGALFENLIIADMHKQYFNQGMPNTLYYWRDKNGTIEVDCLIEQDGKMIPIEIKSGETYTVHYFDTIKKWQTLAANEAEPSYVVYGGTQSLRGPHENLMPWYQAGTLIKRITEE
jgi:predicted AAA+ superfamily ATPase